MGCQSPELANYQGDGALKDDRSFNDDIKDWPFNAINDDGMPVIHIPMRAIQKNTISQKP